MDAHDKAKKLYETAKEAYEASKQVDDVEAEVEVEKPKSKASVASVCYIESYRRPWLIAFYSETRDSSISGGG